MIKQLRQKSTLGDLGVGNSDKDEKDYL